MSSLEAQLLKAEIELDRREIERLRAKLEEAAGKLQGMIVHGNNLVKDYEAREAEIERLRDLLTKWHTIADEKYDEVEWLKAVLRDCIALLEGNITIETQRDAILRGARAAVRDK